MTTRTKIEAEYNVVNGIIRSPGKFEGEPVWSPYFYAFLMEGGGEVVHDADDDDGGITVIEIEPEDIVMFPDLEGHTRISIQESGDGFVTATAT